jgi:hypothetical protein
MRLRIILNNCKSRATMTSTRLLVALALVSLPIVGCDGPRTVVPEVDAAVVEVDAHVEPPDACGGRSERSGTVETFGAPLADCVQFVPYDLLIADPAAYDGLTIETEAVVRANCQVRGCWMELRSPAEPESSSLVVRFLDYGFFVPLDSRGADAGMQGVFSVTTYTPEEVMHAQSEGATFDMILPDGSARVLAFTASGVEMWNR